MHYIRGQVVAGFIKTEHVFSANQLADVLTKSLVSSQTSSFICQDWIHFQGPAWRGV